MEINVEEKQLSVVLKEAKFDVVISAEAPMQVNVGESAKIDVGQAINYIKSGEAEINAAVTAGTNAFNQNATNKTTDFNNNASAKTQDYNDNATAKLNAYNQNATDKTTAFDNNAIAKTGDFDANATNKTNAFNQNATDKTTAFNNNASSKTTDFNDNYTAKKALIDAQVSVAEGAATTAKQYAIGDPSEPAGNSAKYWAEQASSSLSGLTSRVTTIEGKIPSTATANNPLTDKSYVDTADTALQTQIDALSAASDVSDIVGTYAALQAYDTSTLQNNNIIKVLQDETHNNETTYYRWVITGGVGSWVLIGEEGPYYTIAAADATFQEKLVSGTNIKTINNNSIVGSGNLDINGLPSQTGQAGKFLSTDGTDASWQNISVNPDNKSITTNASDQLQTIGVINQNDTTTAINTWTGTKAQYDAIVSKDVNTQYTCTDSGEIYLGTNLIANKAGNRNIGEIVQSTIPLTDAGLHLLDGALISGSGTYADFVTYIAGLVSDYPDIFETEANWQTAVTTYGVCGKFVYDSINNTVRLPKITGFTEGTIDPTVLGDLTTAGLPNITGSLRGYSTSSGYFAPFTATSGAFTVDSDSGAGRSVMASNTNNTGRVRFNASNSSAIYGNSSTVQPQSIKVLYYIVIATSVKTSIEVDIDQIATDLNGKADVDLTNINASCKPLDGQWVASSTILANAVTAPTSTGLDYSLSSYLPNDGYNYEVLFDIEGTTASSSGSYTVGLLKTDISSDCFVCEGRAQSSSGVRAAGNAILPVGTARSVTIRNSSRNTGTITLYARGYRRIGTNS